MKFIIGKKLNMSQVWNEKGDVSPVTIVEATPNVVTQIKSKETDGYGAVQVGAGARREKNVSKAVRGHTKKFGVFAHLREFRTDAPALAVGDTVSVSNFVAGDTVRVSSVSKGKGFQGVVKRHGFKGGPRSHGQKHSEREAGSVGGGLRNRVPKGMRMPGRMGADLITVKNLSVVAVDAENNLLFIKGAVPGRRGTVVEIQG